MLVFSPKQVACMRIFFTMVLFLPFLPRSLRQVPTNRIKYIFLIGFFGSGIPPFLFTAAQTHLNSATAGILNSLTPLFTLLIGMAVFGVAFTRNRLAGVIAGFLGAVSLIAHTAPTNIGEQNSNYFYGIYIVLATICYGFSMNLIKAKTQNLSPLAINSIVFGILGVPAGAYLFSTDFVGRLQNIPGAWQAASSVFVLALFGTAIASVMYYRLAQRTDALFSSMTTYFMPIMAIFWGFFDGEQLDWHYGLGLLLILVGVYLVQKKT